MASDNQLLLDTHVWLWMLEGEAQRLSRAVIQRLKDAAKSSSLIVSEISFWEIANKSANGRLMLSIDSAIWLEKAAQAPGINYLPIERAELIQSTRLSGAPPDDPVDRILIATAQLNGAALVTCDTKVIDYSRRQRGLKVVDARS